MKPIEKLILRKRSRLTKRARMVFSIAIRDQYRAVLHALDHYSIAQLKEILPQIISQEPITNAFDKTYTSATEIATTWRKQLLPPQKDGVEEMYTEHFKKKLREFARTRAASRVTSITDTTRQRIESVINMSIEEGASVSTMRDIITTSIIDDYKEFTPARAQLIAQTEMVTSSNEAAILAARSTGLETRNFWSTSGLPNVRDSHLQAEADSNDSGGVADGEPFSNGLLYPGDPNGPPEEVCNCHCTLLIEIV